MKTDNPQPVLVPPGSGKHIEFLSVQHGLTGRQTGEAYYVFESVFEPGRGNRLHVHQREDEFAYVLEGALEIRLEEGNQVVEAGGLAHLPKLVPHALRNPLEVPSRYLFMAVPAGIDRWFDALAAAEQDGSLNDELFHRLALEHGIEFLE